MNLLNFRNFSNGRVRMFVPGLEAPDHVTAVQLPTDSRRRGKTAVYGQKSKLRSA